MFRDWQIWKYIIILFIGWRLALTLVTYFGLTGLPEIKQPERVLFWSTADADYWGKWDNWDGSYFRSIAEAGYVSSDWTVFFPLYPILIKILMLLGISPFLSGFIVAQISTILALYYLYKLARLDYSEKTTKKILFIFLIFPTSFYLTALYSETLFLALTLSAFYYARKGNWFLASLLASLTAVTRIVGLTVIVGIAGEYLLTNFTQFKIGLIWRTKIRRAGIYSLVLLVTLNILRKVFSTGSNNANALIFALSETVFIIFLFILALIIIEFIWSHLNFRKIFTRPTLYLLLSLIPFILYLMYQYYEWGDPLFFIHKEEIWLRKTTWPWEPIFGYIQQVWFIQSFKAGILYQQTTEFLFLVLLISGWIWGLFKLRLSYLIYFLLIILIPLFSGTLLSFPRFALIAFPLFFLLATIKNELFEKIWIIISVLLLSYFAVSYINSYWVA